MHGQARPGVPIYPEISNQIQIMMGEVLSGAKPPEEALDGAWKADDDAYDEDVSARGRAARSRRRPPGISPGGAHERA